MKSLCRFGCVTNSSQHSPTADELKTLNKRAREQNNDDREEEGQNPISFHLRRRHQQIKFKYKYDVFDNDYSDDGNDGDDFSIHIHITMHGTHMTYSHTCIAHIANYNAETMVLYINFFCSPPLNCWILSSFIFSSFFFPFHFVTVDQSRRAREVNWYIF